MTDMGVASFLNELASIPPTRNKDDYMKDGILYCGTCGEPKQAWIDWLADENGVQEKCLVRVTCKCDEQREAEMAERRKQEDFEASMRSIGEILNTNSKDVAGTFEQDDAPESPTSRACRKYVEDWEAMRENGMGILLYGSKGNGKSFYAASIYNALREKRVLVGYTSTANLMNILSKWDKSEIIDAIKRVQLLVLDDLGAERDTSYSAELMYYVIDERYKTGKPTIVTTNYALANMEQEEEVWRGRIYDRIIEMCPITLKMEGKSRRSGIAEGRKQLAREIMFGVKNGGT